TNDRYRPSAVSYSPDNGFVGAPCALGCGATIGLFPYAESATVCPSDHSPLPSRDTSTTEGVPVRSRLSSAAAMPPARLVPEMVSPKAGPGGWIMPSMPGAVMVAAIPPRHQKAVM